MSKALIGIFVGVFVSALLIEIIDRQDPELISKVRNKIKEKIDKLLEPAPSNRAEAET